MVLFFKKSRLYDGFFVCVFDVSLRCFYKTMIWRGLVEISIDEDSINWHYSG